MSVDELIAHMRQSKLYQYIYHFTDKANYDLIRIHGLLSKKKMRELKLWPPPATGGDELSHKLDSDRGIDPYVSLCMTTNHGMAYKANNDGRLINPCYLKISPEILKENGVMITLGVANELGAKKLPISTAVDMLDIQVLYSRTDWSSPQIKPRLQKVRKYEILVPTGIPASLIYGIAKHGV